MRLLRLTLLALAVLLAGGTRASAADLLPADKPAPAVIDHYLDARLQEEKVKPAAQADDANVLRRLTLDLVGRIPTVAESKAYLASTDSDKRARLVDRLMASSAFVRHLATEFDTMLMGNGRRGSLRPYLLTALKENRPWDQIFRELLLPDAKDPKRKGADQFLRARVRDIDRLSNDVSVLFFGVNISCAQCHDHPLVDDWKQDHFYGMKAFFHRTYEERGHLAEREYVSFQFRTNKGITRQARLMFLTGKVVESPAGSKPPPPKGKKQKRKKGRGGKGGPPPAPPKFSARAQLVSIALQPEQRDFFARAIVNRLWHRFYGRGLVHPIDQMHSANDPSHPELLQWLARDLVEHKYDLRRTIRGLVLSKAYSRSSRYEGERTPQPRLFAVARLRALTPMQLATSMRVATAAPDQFGDKVKPEEIERRLEGMENSARGFASLIEQPRDDFQIGVGEALLFSNDERVQREFLQDGGDRLVGKLKTIKDLPTQVDMAVRNVYSRAPSAEEKKLLLAYLQARKDKPLEACRQLVWALLTSSEFRFNY
jgi:hypothetical protein